MRSKNHHNYNQRTKTKPSGFGAGGLLFLGLAARAGVFGRGMVVLTLGPVLFRAASTFWWLATSSTHLLRRRSQ